jgi:hypothetical protein
MEIKYTKHLKIRLELRKIDYDLPQQREGCNGKAYKHEEK